MLSIGGLEKVQTHRVLLLGVVAEIDRVNTDNEFLIGIE